MKELVRFYALDLDRTLIDTTKVYQQLIKQLDDSSIKDLLDNDRSSVEVSGGSFDVGESLVRAIGQARAQTLLTDFAERTQQNRQQFLLPGAGELVTAIEKSAYLFGVVTTGGDLWQSTKLCATGFDSYPHLITANKYKGQMVKQWLDAGRLPNELGGGAVHEVVLVDDKAVSFQDLPPEAARGYCVQNGPALLSQQGELPANVKLVADLDAVIEREGL